MDTWGSLFNRSGRRTDRYGSIFIRAGLISWARLIVLGVLIVSVTIISVLSSHAAAEDRIRIAIDERVSELTILYNQQPILVYAFSAHHPKPYIKQLHMMSGWNVLTDAPADHSHHHGVMYGVQVNGHNFWQEPPDAGIQQSVRIEDQRVVTTTHGAAEAGFVHVIDWVAAGDRGSTDRQKALLQERRRITAWVDVAKREVAVEWRATFVVGSRDVVLTGDNYNGLGVRPAREFDLKAVHSNSEQTLELQGTEQNLSRAQWSAITLTRPPRQATIALFGDPANTRGPSVFFTMNDPFAYISATQALDTTPLEYAAGAAFDLNFLIAIYDAVKPAAYLNDRAGQWLKQRRSRHAPKAKKPASAN